MRIHNSWILLFFGLSFVGAIPQPSELPSPSNFYARSLVASANLGDFVYFDGGEIVQKTSDEGVVLRQNNATISIDMRQSWTNSTAQLMATEKNSNVPVLKDAILWPHPDKKSFYLWGGQVSALPGISASDEKPVALWEFTIDGQGGGSWSAVTAANADLFSTLRRQAAGMGVVGGDVGYYLGGLETIETEQQFAGLKDQIPIAGIVTYNMTSNTWTNDSAAGYALFDRGAHGEAAFMPQFGKGGLLAFLGGYRPGPDKLLNDGSALVSFNNISLYEPSSKTWHYQQTTGNAPKPRSEFCSRSLTSPDGTHEIIVHGGYNPGAKEYFDDLFVLTIPGFQWFQANYTALQARVGVSCEIVGNRQLLTIGGAINSSVHDIFPNALGIFDLTDLTRKSEYDAGAASYQSAQVIRDWYKAGNGNSVQWTSDTTHNLFVNASTPAPSSPASTSTATGKSSDHTGAIAGGVVGGVAVLGILGAAIFFLRRRRRRDHNTPPSSAVGEVGKVPVAYEVQEMPPDYGRHEMGNDGEVQQRFELPTSSEARS